MKEKLLYCPPFRVPDTWELSEKFPLNVKTSVKTSVLAYLFVKVKEIVCELLEPVTIKSIRAETPEEDVRVSVAVPPITELDSEQFNDSVVLEDVPDQTPEKSKVAGHVMSSAFLQAMRDKTKNKKIIRDFIALFLMLIPFRPLEARWNLPRLLGATLSNGTDKLKNNFIINQG